MKSPCSPQRLEGELAGENVSPGCFVDKDDARVAELLEARDEALELELGDDNVVVEKGSVVNGAEGRALVTRMVEDAEPESRAELERDPWSSVFAVVVESLPTGVRELWPVALTPETASEAEEVGGFNGVGELTKLEASWLGRGPVML